MTVPLLPTRFLFRFAAPCRKREPLWTPDGEPLDESHGLVTLAALEGWATWAEFRAAWSEAGLVVAAVVETRAEDGGRKAERTGPFARHEAGLHLWIDTRDVRNIHRAGRFCHRFQFILPKAEKKVPGTISTKKKRFLEPFIPVAGEWVPIERAKEQPKPVKAKLLHGRCRRGEQGYRIEAFVPAEALTGFDPVDHPRLGFTCAISDHELGEQTFGVGGPMPYWEDPSLWATLELVS